MHRSRVYAVLIDTPREAVDEVASELPNAIPDDIEAEIARLQAPLPVESDQEQFAAEADTWN